MGGSQSQDVQNHQLAKFAATGSLSSVRAERTKPQDEKNIQTLTRLITAKSVREKERANEESEYNQENMQLLKHLFKKMDPSVMRTSAQTTHGEIQLSFKYEATKELLLVKVIKCCDLSAKDLRGHCSDPYVKMFLHPLTNPSEARRTQVVHKTLNPTYHEILTFPILDEQITNGRMVVQVWDKDIMDRDDLIGEAIIRLDTFDFHLSPVHTAWYTLNAETNLEITGNLEISLAYELPGTLKVTLIKGNNLTNHYEEGLPNPFVKIQIPGLNAVYETQDKEGTVDPVWEETFECNMPIEELTERYIIFHVVDRADLDQNDSLGQIVIELSNFNPETGFHGTFDLADLKNTDRLRAKWFQHATVQEFREALTAHAHFRQPKFLFQRHDGAKTIRVTSRKAGSQAKIRIVDGIPVY